MTAAIQLEGCPRCQRDETVEIAIGRSGDGRAVVIADLHVKTARGAVRNLAADGAKTEDAQTLAGNGRGVDTPLVLPCPSVDVTIDVSTVDTRTPDRDKDLKSDKFFDVEHYPTMAFKSTKVEQAGAGKLKVTGDLTIRGTTKSVVLDVDGPTAPVKDPWGNQRSAVTATTKINRQDFGVKWNATMDNGGVVVGDEVTITIDAEMVQKK